MRTDDATIAAPLSATLALLGALAPVASDLYLAVLPPPGMDLKPTPTDPRTSLTAFMFGAGVGHVVFGVLADRVGRRVPLILETVYSSWPASAPLLQRRPTCSCWRGSCKVWRGSRAYSSDA